MQDNQDQHAQQVMQRTNQTVLAAEKVLYDKSTHDKMFRMINSASRDPAKRAAAGAVLSLSAVIQQAPHVDPETIVPAGVYLIADILNFFERTEHKEYGEDVHKKAFMEFAGKLQQLAGVQHG